MSNSNGINWKTFLVSVLGTAIGVALTFSLNGLRESRNKAQAQRLTAIMVIHDIDITIDALKGLKDNEQKINDYSKFTFEHADRLEDVPIDTLYSLVYLISRPDAPFRFDTSKEKIFHSSLDSWQNLGDVKFMDNVQQFYYERQQFQDILDNSPQWLEPLTDKFLYKLYIKHGMTDAEKYYKDLRAYFKEKLKDEDVMAFLSLSDQRIQTLNGYIDRWSKFNDENKFQMGISDAEMENYINSMKELGKPVSERALAGDWGYTLEDGNTYEYTFRKDHSFSMSRNASQLWHATYWSGKFKFRFQSGGTWTMEGDSLVMVHNPEIFALSLDTSELVPIKGKEDSLARWAGNYQKESTEEQKAYVEKSPRNAVKPRMDPSGDKMEWTTASGNVVYIKRKTE